ncbi:MAG: GAF domain-containing protein [Thermodesulfobacteriota bacterium]
MATTQKNRRGNTGESQAKNQAAIDILLTVVREEYGRIPARLNRLLKDVADLYEGRWPTHEACEAPYHNFGHALDAAITVTRMAAGWNRSASQRKFPEELFLCGIAAGLFHDSGYIKDKGDREGHGGKYTFTHVERGMEMARHYLAEAQWPTRARELVPAMISLTDYRQEPEAAALFADPLELAMARMIPTADLVAQMADNRYLPRLKDLFVEFKEVYEHEGTEQIRQLGAPVYKSAKELKDGVLHFYEEFVAPRLARHGHMDRYLTIFFGEGSNPYHENIAANLSSHLLDLRGQWRRLGDVLRDLGLASCDQINAAIAAQQGKKHSRLSNASLLNAIKECLLPWMDSHVNGKCLGDILMDMNAISPSALAKGLLHQMLPESLLENMTHQELATLFRISVLLHNICKGPWILHEALEMTNTLIGCEASSILLTRPGTEEMLISLPTGPRSKVLQGQAIRVEMGLAGWVFRNCQPAIVANVLTDGRFDRAVDHRFAFETRSLLAVPLRLNGVCIGVIEAVNKRDDNFNEHDMHILTMLANIVSSALLSIIHEHLAH